jgi:hypothetical protein
MEELVWRKKGDEGCIKSYRPAVANQITLPTEKKALDGDLQHFTQNVHALPSLNEGLGLAERAACGAGGLPPLNRREEVCAKMNERHLVGQSTQNPFMPNSNYARDLEAQMNFLTPKQ